MRVRIIRSGVTSMGASDAPQGARMARQGSRPLRRPRARGRLHGRAAMRGGAGLTDPGGLASCRLRPAARRAAAAGVGAGGKGIAGGAAGHLLRAERALGLDQAGARSALRRAAGGAMRGGPPRARGGRRRGRWGPCGGAGGTHWAGFGRSLPGAGRRSGGGLGCAARRAEPGGAVEAILFLSVSCVYFRQVSQCFGCGHGP
ncbi:MAG: hypothetical protein J3K34DRAFT_433886, partial [Monoraphidium minutum]